MNKEFKRYLVAVLFERKFDLALETLEKMKVIFPEDLIFLEKLEKKVSEAKQEKGSPTAPYLCLLGTLKNHADCGNMEDYAVYGFALFHYGSSDAIRMKGFEMLERAATRGQRDELLELGQEYLNGISVPKDEAKGFSYVLQYSQISDDPFVHAIIGRCYMRGNGVKIDKEKGYRWLKEGMEKGSDYCKVLYYGEILVDDDSTPEEQDKAFAVLEEIILHDVDSRDAEIYIGSYLVKQNEFDEARTWLERVVSMGYAESMLDLAKVYLRINNHEARDQARDILEHCEDFELTGYERHLMLMYFEGIGGPIEYAKTGNLVFDWLSRKPGEPDALAMKAYLEWLCSEGEEKQQAKEEFLKWVEKKNPIALFLYGEQAISGEVTKENVELMLSRMKESLDMREDPVIRDKFLNLALTHKCDYPEYDFEDELEKSIKFGHTMAYYIYGIIYEHGFGVKKDMAKALEYFEMGAKAEDEDCAFELAMYYSQQGDDEKHYQYIELCCQLGEVESLLHVGEDFIQCPEPEKHQVGIELLKRAKKFGSKEAKKLLKKYSK